MPAQFRRKVSLNLCRIWSSVSTSTPPVMAVRFVATADPIAAPMYVTEFGGRFPVVPAIVHSTGTSTTVDPDGSTSGCVEA